jgi:protein TonB
MPRDLFGDVTRPSISIGNRKRYTVPVSLLSHSAIVLAVVVIPLVATDAVPKPWQPMGGVIIDLIPPTPPPAPKPRVEKVSPPADPNAVPREVPEGISPEKPVEPREPVEFDTPGIIGGDADVERILAPLPEVTAAPPEPIRVGGNIRSPQKVRHVDPVYPQLAILSRIEDVVIIEATIGPDGRLMDARVLRGHQMLTQAALVAVRQWEFTPTLLNGVPVPVIMTVTVRFTLSK